MVIVTFIASKQRVPTDPVTLCPKETRTRTGNRIRGYERNKKTLKGRGCAYSSPGRNKITFVQDKNEMFPVFLFFEIRFHMRGASAHRISGIKNLNNNIR